jgi:hypothetical protein
LINEVFICHKDAKAQRITKKIPFETAPLERVQILHEETPLNRTHPNPSLEKRRPY